LNRQLGDALFHPSSLVNFRHRLEEHQQSALGFQRILAGLEQAGLVLRQSRQRLDSTQMLGRVSKMNRLDCVRESLRLALREVALGLAESAKDWVQGEQARLLARVFEEQFEVRAGGAAPQPTNKEPVADRSAEVLAPPPAVTGTATTLAQNPEGPLAAPPVRQLGRI
jgi:hypothetical protein